ncbi:MAG TPA: HAD family hydrolase [Vicinamibacteria bacterium]|nr:HAD family hydrolase [Vicinamibacteria bacterium]
MRPGRLRAVLFDWDGTLADTAEISFQVYAALFASFDIAYERDDFERTYSPDWYRTFEAMGLPRERWPEADERWLELYARERSQLLPGSAEGLAGLREHGLLLGLVTSGTRSRVERDLERLEVGGFFGVVICGGDTVNRKPHPEPLLVALDRLDVAAGDAAYVGDSPEDVAMSRAAGVFCIGIPGGFPNHAALATAGPDLLSESLAAAIRELVG